MELRFIAYWIAGTMIAADAVIVAGLSFEYVLPVVLAFPQLDLVEALSALGATAFLLFIQVFFVPLIAFLFDFPPEQL